MIVRGTAELAAKTDRIAGRLENPSGASSQLTGAFQARIEHRFASAGDGSWAPHAPATIERWGPHPLLRATGALQAAMTGGRAEVSGQQIRYSPSGDLFYGAIVAARRPIVREDDPELGEQLTEALAEHVMGGE